MYAEKDSSGDLLLANLDNVFDKFLNDRESDRSGAFDGDTVGNGLAGFGDYGVSGFEAWVDPGDILCLNADDADIWFQSLDRCCNS